MRVFSHQGPRIFILSLSLFTADIAFSQSRTARTIRFDSQALGGQATAAVLLPVDYDSTTLRYPVLYLLHG